MAARPAAATHARLLLFLHLAKTGGVTLADILARNLATEEFLQINMWETGASAMGTWSHGALERALDRLQKPQVDKLRAVWGHYRQGIQGYLPKPCAVVTLLRDPVDRIISAYYYSDQMAPKSLDILEDYVASRHLNIGFDNYMCRILSGRPSLDPIAAEPDATTENFPLLTEADFEAAATHLDGFLSLERPINSTRRFLFWVPTCAGRSAISSTDRSMSPRPVRRTPIFRTRCARKFWAGIDTTPF